MKALKKQQKLTESSKHKHVILQIAYFNNSAIIIVKRLCSNHEVLLFSSNNGRSPLDRVFESLIVYYGTQNEHCFIITQRLTKQIFDKITAVISLW